MDELKKSLDEIETATENIRKSRKAKKSEPMPDDVTENPPDAPAKGDAGDDVPAKPTQPPADNPEDSDAPDEKKDPKDVEKCEANGDVNMVKSDGEAEGESGEAGIRKSFESDPDIAESLKSGVFAASIVDVLVKSLANITEQVNGVRQSVTKLAEANAELAKSLAADKSGEDMAKSEGASKRIEDIEKSLNDRMESIQKVLNDMTSPMRKSVAGVTVKERDFHASVEGVQAPASSGFSVDAADKREVLGMMTKSLMSGEQSPITSLDIVSFESGSPLRPEVKSYLEKMPSK